MNDFNSFYLVEINIFITIRIELHSFLHFFHSFLNILGQIKMLKPRTRTVLSTAMSVELTLSRSASFVSSIIDPSAFFVHFFNSFLLIWKILVRDDLRRSQIETLNSQGHRGRAVLTNSSPLAQKAKESLKSSSVKVKLNKPIFLFTFGPKASVCEPMVSVVPIYLVASSTASWKFFISPCDLCVYRSIPALKFLLNAVSNFSYVWLKHLISRQNGPWSHGQSDVHMSGFHVDNRSHDQF